MSGFLLDTNVLSELRKGDRADPGVVDWLGHQTDSTLRISVLSVGEIRRGIPLVQRHDPQQAAGLDRWLRRLVESWSSRILPVDDRAAEIWAELMTPDPRPVIDALLGATALRHDLTLVTRNVSDLEGSGVRLLNPFSVSPG